MSVKTAITIAVLGMCFTGSAQAEGFFSVGKGGMFDQGSGFESVSLGIGMSEAYRAGFTQNSDVIVAAAIMARSGDEQLTAELVQATVATWVEQDEEFADIIAAAKAGAYLGVEGDSSLEAAGTLEVLDWSWRSATTPSTATAASIDHHSISNVEGYGVQVVDGRPIFDMQALGVQVADGRPIFETYDMMVGGPAAMAVSFNSGS